MNSAQRRAARRARSLVRFAPGARGSVLLYTEEVDGIVWLHSVDHEYTPEALRRFAADAYLCRLPMLAARFWKRHRRFARRLLEVLQ